MNSGSEIGDPVVIPWSSIGPLAGLLGIWIVGLGAYAIRCAVRGRYRRARVDQMGGSILLNNWTMEFGYWMVDGVSRGLMRLGVSPLLLTALSLVLAAGAAVALYSGSFGVGGWLVVASGLFDLFDGEVARARGVAGEAGEFVDALVDRYAELLPLLAAAGYYLHHAPPAALVVALALVASLMITFVRTKAEAQGVTDLPGGLMRRHERVLYIGVGAASSPLPAVWLEPGATRPLYHLALLGFGLVALVGNIVAVRQAVRVYRRLR